MKRALLMAVYCPLAFLAWWFDFFAEMAYESLYRENTRRAELKRQPQSDGEAKP